MSTRCNTTQDSELLLQRNTCDDLRAQVTRNAANEAAICCLAAAACKFCNALSSLPLPPTAITLRRWQTLRHRWQTSRSSCRYNQLAAAFSICFKHVARIIRHVSHFHRSHIPHFLTLDHQAERRHHAATAEKLRLKTAAFTALASDAKNLKEKGSRG